LELFSFEYYKNAYLNYNFHGERNTFDEDNFLNNNFDKEKIIHVINNTKEYIPLLLKEMNEKGIVYNNEIGYEIKLPLSCDEKGIVTNDRKGWVFDLLFYLDENNKDFIISRFLLEKYFGSSFYIENDYDEKKVYCESEETFRNVLMPKIDITGSYKDFKTKYEEYFGKSLERKNN
jgi:hypothetical protein